MTLLSLLCMYNVLAKVGVDSIKTKYKFRVMSSSEFAVMASSCPEISHVKLRATYIQTVSHWFSPVFTLIPGLIMFGKFEWSNT